MSNGEIILYNTEDGAARIRLRSADGSVWLTQAEIAELFQTTKQNVSLHLKNIFDDDELAEESVVKESLTTASMRNFRSSKSGWRTPGRRRNSPPI